MSLDAIQWDFSNLSKRDGLLEAFLAYCVSWMVEL